MTITREVREKVIQLSNEGRGRNEIARLLTGQGFHISEGSTGNIIRAYLKHEQSLQNQSSDNDNNSSTGLGLKKTGSPLLAENGTWLAVPINPNYNVSIHRPRRRNGSPLSHLIVEENEKVSRPPKSSIPEVNINNNEKYLQNSWKIVQ